MTEKLPVYTLGDRFATMSRRGTTRIWQVDSDGIPHITAGPPCCSDHGARCKLDRPECCPSCPAEVLEPA